MPLRYLVTGCAGFIAARTVEHLLKEGHEVVGLDNLNDAYGQALKCWRLERLLGHAGFTFHPIDVSDPQQLSPLSYSSNLKEQYASFTAVLHLAARSGVRSSVAEPLAYLATNVVGTQNMLNFCRDRQIGKFVLASSSSVYGSASPIPYREEADISQPASPYAASKVAAEALSHAAHVVHGLDVSVLRFFTVYGPAGRPDMSVYRFMRAIDSGQPLAVYGDGSQSRDFTYVDDIVKGVLAALRPVGYRTFNLGGDAPCTVSELIQQLEKVIGKPAQVIHEAPHPADVPATWASIDRARRELDWAPKVSLGEGLRRTFAWYQHERDWAKNIES